jgi:hypothetical protein
MSLPRGPSLHKIVHRSDVYDMVLMRMYNEYVQVNSSVVLGHKMYVWPIYVGIFW